LFFPLAILQAPVFFQVLERLHNSALRVPLPRAGRLRFGIVDVGSPLFFYPFVLWSESPFWGQRLALFGYSAFFLDTSPFPVQRIRVDTGFGLRYFYLRKTPVSLFQSALAFSSLEVPFGHPLFPEPILTIRGRAEAHRAPSKARSTASAGAGLPPHPPSPLTFDRHHVPRPPPPTLSLFPLVFLFNAGFRGDISVFRLRHKDENSSVVIAFFLLIRVPPFHSIGPKHISSAIPELAINLFYYGAERESTPTPFLQSLFSFWGSTAAGAVRLRLP